MGYVKTDKKSEPRKPYFSDLDIVRIKDKMGLVEQFTRVSYEFSEEGLRITVDGVEGDFTFTHPASARAFLDAFMEGYNMGYGDGREDSLK